ncbi:MAG: hypothetical protein ACI8UO_000553 [Verrucomicrobiales bacterium]
MLRFCVVSLLLAAASALGQNLLTNGDFEAIDEGGWEYHGVNDGARGVYSEPTRPGSHSYLIELAGNSEWGESVIRQQVAVEPTATYRLKFDLFDNCERQSPTGVRQIVRVGDQTAFARDLGAAPAGRGWIQRQIVFEPRESEITIEFIVRGQGAMREETTTAIDNVRLEKIEDVEFAQPLFRGRPLAPVADRQRLPIAVELAEPGWGGLQRFQMDEARIPAIAQWKTEWNLDRDGFAETQGAVDPWVRQGIVPIVAARISAVSISEIAAGNHDDFFQSWAKEARIWGYPILLRLCPEMETVTGIDSKQFVFAWQRIHGLFKEEGARNVLWFWTPQTLNRSSKSFYPGSAFVDVVGCSVGASWSEFNQNYDYHSSQYGTKAFAVAEAEPNGAWLSQLFGGVVEDFPRLEFMCLSGVEPGTNAGFQKWFGSKMNPPRLAQAELPTIRAEVWRRGGSARVRLTMVDGKLTPRSFRVRVEFWNGTPAAAGSKRVGGEHWVTLEPGKSRDVKEPWPKSSSGKIGVLIDPTVDPEFFAEVRASRVFTED